MRSRVVITGIGTINPLANNVEDTWQALSEGKSGITEITKFDASGFESRIAGEVKNFDPTGYISKKDLRRIDTFIQYAVVSCDEALKMAGLQISEELAPEVGISIGVGVGGFSKTHHYSKILEEKGPSKISPFFIPTIITNMAAGYLSIKYGTKGYNTSTVSACASANHSIGDAGRIIERGDAKVMIAGGVEAIVGPLAIGGFCAMKALSRRNDEPEKASRPYDRDRDGFVLSEGCGMLIMEDLDFARSRGAKILAELSGYGASSDAYHITKPSTEGACLAIRKAIKDAGVSEEEIDYINAHGTSTPLGDISEIKAIKMALGEKAAKKTSISSTKSMTGHLLGGAGGLEAVISILAIRRNLIPPTINIYNLDPECDLDVTPNKAVEKEVNVCLSNSFGFGGTNSSLIFKKIQDE